LSAMSITHPGGTGDYFTVNATGANGKPRTARAAQSAVWGRAQIAGVTLRAVGFDGAGNPVAPDAGAEEIRVFRVA
jgi:hypothetical protein